MKINRAIFGMMVMIVCLPLASLGQHKYPRITLEYIPLFDTPCSQVTNKTIPEAAVRELESKMDSFRAVWDKNADILFKTASKITGQPFRFAESKAAMFLCEGFPSMSLPLMFNMRRFLTATAKEKPDPDAVFVNLVFHETMHRYLGDCISRLPNRTTTLLEKYKNEPRVVINHLHLAALEKMVYAKLGRMDELAAVAAAEKTLRAAAVFARVREIVELEGAESFVKELR